METRTTVTVGASRTFYAVAVLFMNPLTNKHILSCELFAVSGDNPLTEREATQRGREQCESKWRPEEFGSLTAWMFTNAALSWVTTTIAPH